jgi:hypothetical protein
MPLGPACPEAANGGYANACGKFFIDLDESLIKKLFANPGFIFKNRGYWTAVARHWGTIENLRPSPGPNSAPAQSQLLGATGPATDRTRLHHASARRAATTEGGGSRPAYAYMKKYVAAPVGTAIAVLFIAPVSLMGVSSAHADTGMSGYLGCIRGGAAQATCRGLVADYSNY